MKSHESAENYLETILVVKQKLGYVRSIDIANALGFSKPSISRAVGLLKEQNLITVDPSGFISLTEEGSVVANNIWDRHNTVKDFLISIGVNSEVAEEDACRIEHIISEETFTKIKNLKK